MGDRIFRNRWLELCSYSKDSHSIVFTTGCDEYPGNRLRFTGFGYWLSVRLPEIVPPYREKVHATTWDAATIERLGRDWYWHVDERCFGIGIHCRDHFNVYFGRQSDDSRTERRWSCFLPWTQWEVVRWSGYGLDGEWLLDFAQDVREWSPQRDALPKARFLFRDFDGEEITAACHIEEREWRKGHGWWRWQRLFVKPSVRRSLSIAFSAEVGRRKGSWKGGTLGHGIDMLPSELHEAAFCRYCAERELTFIGVQESPPEPRANAHGGRGMTLRECMEAEEP